MSETCGSCRFFNRHPSREVPPEPQLTKKFLGLTMARDGFSVRVERMRRHNIIDHNESGWCRRFPEAAEKHFSSTCGEYQPRKET